MHLSNPISRFTHLKDTPSSFVGNAGKAPIVNGAENALAFADIPDYLFIADLHIVDDFTNFTSNLVGTGTVNQELSRGRVSSGANANSEAVLYDSLFLSVSGGGLVDNANFDVVNELLVAACMDAGGASSAIYTFFRYSADLTIGDLAGEGFGFRYRRSSYNLYAESHDGVANEQTLVSTGVALHDMLHRYKIVHTPATSVAFYLDDVLVATHTVRVPAGTLGNCNLVIGAENTGVAQDIEMTVTRMIHRKAWG